MAAGARGRARRAGARREAEARRASRQPCRERLLHQRLRRGADRHARRLWLGAGRQRQHRTRREDRAHPRPGVSALARDVLRVGDVGAGIHAEPARREDRRPGRVRRSRSARRPPADAVRAGQRRFPHRRDQQPVLRAAAGERSSRRSTSPPRISGCWKRSRPRTWRST